MSGCSIRPAACCCPNQRTTLMQSVIRLLTRSNPRRYCVRARRTRNNNRSPSGPPEVLLTKELSVIVVRRSLASCTLVIVRKFGEMSSKLPSSGQQRFVRYGCYNGGTEYHKTFERIIFAIQWQRRVSSVFPLSHCMGCSFAQMHIRVMCKSSLFVTCVSDTVRMFQYTFSNSL